MVAQVSRKPLDCGPFHHSGSICPSMSLLGSLSSHTKSRLKFPKLLPSPRLFSFSIRIHTAEVVFFSSVFHSDFPNISFLLPDFLAVSCLKVINPTQDPKGMEEDLTQNCPVRLSLTKKQHIEGRTFPAHPRLHTLKPATVPERSIIETKEAARWW